MCVCVCVCANIVPKYLFAGLMEINICAKNIIIFDLLILFKYTENDLLRFQLLQKSFILIFDWLSSFLGITHYFIIIKYRLLRKSN